jgi:hypothetical protein
LSNHHLILGTIIDFISEDTLDDTLDERHRQLIGHLLVEQMGYKKTQITPRHELEIRIPEKCARLLITYIIKIEDRIAMLIQYGPGSLVTRHRPALAMARLVTNYQIPRVVVSNGEQADILDGSNGDLLYTGLENIPNCDELTKLVQQHAWSTISKERAEMESRILMAFEVDDRCPCDDSTCKVSLDG